MWIKRKYSNFMRWYKKIYCHKYKVNLHVENKLPLFQKIKYNLLGFTDEDYYEFNLKNNDYHNYISYQERWRLEKLDGQYAIYLGDKLNFERLFGRYVNVPHIFCWIKNKQFYDLESGACIDAIELMKNNKKIIAKPARSAGGGIGVSLLEYKNGKLYINDNEKKEDEFIRMLSNSDDYILVQYVNSGSYAKKVFDKTTNTLRLVSTIDDKGNVDFVLAFHRFGCVESIPVDNISSGGVFSLVDLETGMLSAGRRITTVDKEYDIHPDTGAAIKGVVIPEWQNILKSIEKAHKCFPFLPFLAWDIVVDDNNDYWILEINRGCDLYVQMIKPLRYEKIGNYMKEKGLLNNW